MKVYFSLVTYKHSLSDIEPLLTSLTKLKETSSSRYEYYLCIHENKSSNSLLSAESVSRYCNLPVLYSSSANVGFGAANNINFAKIASKDSYFVVVNPDVEFINVPLWILFDFMRAHTSIVAVSPRIVDAYGNTQFSAKTDPSFLSLLLGRLSLLQRLPFFSSYYCAHINLNLNYTTTLIPCNYLSGCFLVMRSSTYKTVNGFDERFFLHLEDADLSKRLCMHGYLVHLPIVTVVHRWARGSHKSLFQTICLFKSYLYFVSKWGFKLF